MRGEGDRRSRHDLQEHVGDPPVAPSELGDSPGGLGIPARALGGGVKLENRVAEILGNPTASVSGGDGLPEEWLLEAIDDPQPVVLPREPVEEMQEL